MTPTVDAFDSSGYARSNLLSSNDFYTFYYSGVGTQVIKLNYSQVGGQNIDLDLILLKSNYRYIDDDQEVRGGQSSAAYTAAKSRRSNPAVEVGQEQISLAGLGAGYYLINIKALTYDSVSQTRFTSAALMGTARYHLQLDTNGTTTEFLCPAH